MFSADLGDIVVGLGTFALAAVTVYVSLKQSSAEKRRVIAEFRLKWVENFRETVVKRASCDVEIVQLLGKERTPEIQSKIDATFLKRNELSALLVMMINPSGLDPDEDELKNIMGGKTSGNKTVHLENRARILFLTEKILSKEWKRIKTEIND